LFAIGKLTFNRCGSLTTFLVTRSTPTPDPQPAVWSSLPTTRIPSGGFPPELKPTPSKGSLIGIHAPDHIIEQLGGTFEACATMAAVLSPHRITPDSTSFARGELYLWWTPTWPNDRQPSPSRRAVVRTLLTLAVRARAEGLSNAAASGEPLMPFMSYDMWRLVLGFIKHTEFML
jgi:hypothetical protein